MGAEISGKGKGGIPLIASGELGVTGSIVRSSGSARTEVRERAGLSQVQREIAGSDYVVLVDDFHYMSRDVQAEVAKALKEAVRLNIKICTAAVLHRGDDVLRANPELRGRVSSIDLNYWMIEELVQIAVLGFDQLGLNIVWDDLRKLAIEAAGSPQLMQQICLQTCFVLNVRTALDTRIDVDLNETTLARIFEQVSTTADFRSLVNVLDAGPKTRGTERKMYRFGDGTFGDVYRCVLKAVASDPPLLSFPYDQLLHRVESVCDEEGPVGSSVTGTCVHMARLAEDKFPSERVIDWDEQKQILDIPDPYLLFYLRWSGRLNEPNQ